MSNFRFGRNTPKEIDDSITNITPLNTKNSRNSIWRQFEKFCGERKYVFDETLPRKNSIHPQRLGYNMKKVDGNDHKEAEESDNCGLPTGRIEYNCIFSKTAQGGSHKLTDSKWLATNTTDPRICPVRLYKKMLSKRGKHITTDRLFLTPNPAWREPSSVGWFKNSPVGRNEMGGMDKNRRRRNRHRHKEKED
ncbi:hypothetical protein Zmor_000371 [Zophobas morio]|uniref:ZMYM2-like/QRICH1 C-terminal domain-containing protein n=1 Tax=Zophobas morio TaxID=2755281 RepID=A0AA38IW22_9CUCU|nr:hypothetical protein Zmor_000371 [Zophobas morio]